jgi:hypothetical protein
MWEIPIFIAEVLILSVLLSSSAALAQQTEAQPYHVEAGPYQIDVVASASNLSLGSVQYLVRVYDAQTGQPMYDARVLIRARHIDIDEEGWANALNTPVSPAEYTARVELDSPGVWAISVDVSSDLGRVEVEVPPQTVPAPSQSTAGGLVFIGVFVVLIAGGAYLTWTIRRTQQRREVSSAG